MKKYLTLIAVALIAISISLYAAIGPKTYECMATPYGGNEHHTIYYAHNVKVVDSNFYFKIIDGKKIYESGFLTTEYFNGTPVEINLNQTTNLGFVKNSDNTYKLIELRHGEHMVVISNCNKI